MPPKRSIGGSGDAGASEAPAQRVKLATEVSVAADEVSRGQLVCTQMRLRPAPAPDVDLGPGYAARNAPGPEEPVESPADRIRDLSDGIHGEIISLLPTKDGWRTQVLTSRWRTLWRTAPLNLDCCQLSVDDDSKLPGAIISSHEGSVQCICISACYLLDIPCMVAAWLTSRQFDKLQQLEFYHDYVCNIPRTDVSMPSPPMSITWFSSYLHIATFAGAIQQTIWYKCFDSHC
nr:uncharacterized protein LOC109770892 [Aegilops tauschii subsp. strangulata]